MFFASKADEKDTTTFLLRISEGLPGKLASPRLLFLSIHITLVLCWCGPLDFGPDQLVVCFLEEDAANNGGNQRHNNWVE